METTRIPLNVCTSCGSPNEAATDVGDKVKPSEGSISICFMCGHLMAFKADMTLRELNDQEIYDLAGHPEILRLQKARQVVMAMRNASTKSES